MIRPSEKALSIAEDLLDYVHPGMSRAAALQEVAQMVDEMNSELLEAIQALLAEADRSGLGPNDALLHHIRQLLVEYQPWRVDSASQHELFGPRTSTATRSEAIAGKMP